MDLNPIYGFKVDNGRDIEAKARFADQSGFRHIEIQIDDCSRNSYMFSREFAEGVRKATSLYGLTISYHATIGINFADKIPRMRDAAVEISQDMVRLCADTNGSWLTVHIGSMGIPRTPESRRRRLRYAAESIKGMLETPRSDNVSISLENMPINGAGMESVLFGESSDDIQHIIDALDSDRVKTTFDVGHANIQQDPTAFFSEISRHVVGIHAHDNAGIMDSHLPVGEGSVPWLKWCRKIAELTAPVPLIVELKPFDEYAVLLSKSRIEGYLAEIMVQAGSVDE